jgi:hypothetical protein
MTNFSIKYIENILYLFDDDNNVNLTEKTCSNLKGKKNICIQTWLLNLVIFVALLSFPFGRLFYFYSY